MPYVTEMLWKELGGEGMLMIADWPKPQSRADADAEKIMSSLQEVVSAIRSIRSDYKVTSDKLVDAVVEAPLYAKEFINFEPVIKTLGRVNDLKIGKKMDRPEQAATVTVGLNSICIPLAELVDLDKEKKRIEDDLDATKKFIVSIEARLGNKEFVGKAPAKVVEGEKAKLVEAQEKIKKLNDQLKVLR
jgi:valyl-tRNA synthetase